MSTNKSTLRQLLDALKTIKSADPAELTKIAQDEDLAKAAASVDKVLDNFDESKIHAGPSKEEIKTGPAQEASGSGAAKMVGTYSDPTPQKGVTEQAEGYARMLGAMATSVKSLAEAVASVVKNQETVMDLLKAKDDEDEEEETEVVEIKESKTKAKNLLAAARKSLTKAAESDDAAAIKAAKSEAGKFLRKATLLAALSGDEALQKSISDLITKADVNVVEEEEEEDEADKAKAAAEAAAKAGAKDDSKASAENQDKWPEMKAMANKVDQALAGLGMLKTDIQGLLETVAGQSKNAHTRPESFAKGGKEEDENSVMKRIEDAVEAGSISGSEVMAAKDIASLMNGVNKGAVPASVLKARVSQTTPGVRALFADVAA